METFDQINVNTIAIVGTGPSVKGQKIKGDLVIAVNSAIKICNPDWWFTLDPSDSNLEIMENPIKTIRYFAAVPKNKILPPHVCRLDRIAEIKGVAKNLMRRGRRVDKRNYYLARWSAKMGLCEDKEKIHTGNSLWGALGLAYHCRPENIIFYGLDGTQEPRITGGRPNRLDHLPILFRSALPQLKKAGINVYNANPNSKVDCFLPLDKLTMVC